MQSQKNKQRKPYIAGLAQLSFNPTFDWEIEEAAEMFENAKHSMDVDQIKYEDCISGIDKLSPESIDLIIADPPFGIKFNGKGSQYNRNSDLVVEGYQEIDRDYDDFSKTWISKLPRIMKDTSTAYIFSGWTNLGDIISAVKRSNLSVINHIIWKYQFGVFTKKKYVTSHYHILFLAKNPKKYFFNMIEHYPLDVWEIPRKYRQGQRKNGTKLPEDLVCRCIDFSSRPGDVVFDPFMGNATTAICAKMKYRHYFGFEINTKMIELIDQNIRQIELGEAYQPYRNNKPSIEELKKKYPGVRKKLQENSSLEEKQSELDAFMK